MTRITERLYTFAKEPIPQDTMLNPISDNNLLAKDINLSKILFSENGRGVTLFLSNMINGNEISKLILRKLIYFNFKNNFEDDEDAFPVYVGAVFCKKTSSQDLYSYLTEVKYGFLDQNGNFSIPKINNFYMVHLEGGEATIDVVCGDYLYETVN